MKLIGKYIKAKELKPLWEILSKADEVVIALESLVNNDLEGFIRYLPEKCTFYVGTDQYRTDPRAIRKLIEYGHTVYLTHPKKVSFYPRLFYVRSGKRVGILAGSAALVSAEDSPNAEISVLIETEKGDSIHKQFKAVIKNYGANATLIEQDLHLDRYEREYEMYWFWHSRANNEFSSELEAQRKIVSEQLYDAYQQYIEEGGKDSYKARLKKSNQVMRLMNRLISVYIISDESFLEYYKDIAAGLKSSAIDEDNRIITEQYWLVVNALKFVNKHTTNEASWVFEALRSLLLPANGYGVQWLSEVMNIYNPARFSAVHEEATESLSHLGLAKFPKVQKAYFDASSYLRYNKLIIELQLLFGAEDLLQVDDFLRWYHGKFVAAQPAR